MVNSRFLLCDIYNVVLVRCKNCKHSAYAILNHLPHEFEFAIGWYKANGSIAIEFTKLNALMKLAIVDFNSVGSTQRAKEAK